MSENNESRKLTWKAIGISLRVGNSISSVYFTAFRYTMKQFFRLERSDFVFCNHLYTTASLNTSQRIAVSSYILQHFCSSFQRIFLMLKSISCLFLLAKLSLHLECPLQLKEYIFLFELFLRKISQCPPVGSSVLQWVFGSFRGRYKTCVSTFPSNEAVSRTLTFFIHPRWHHSSSQYGTTASPFPSIPSAEACLVVGPWPHTAFEESLFWEYEKSTRRVSGKKPPPF